MPANTSPIFTVTPLTSIGGSIATASNTYTGTSGTTTVFTAGANGAFIQKIILEALGTNIATVARFFVNNGSSSGSASNNSLVYQISLPATTASATAATAHIEIPLNIQVAAGYTILACVATTVSAGWQVTVVGGNY